MSKQFSTNPENSSENNQETTKVEESKQKEQKEDYNLNDVVKQDDHEKNKQVLPKRENDENKGAQDGKRQERHRRDNRRDDRRNDRRDDDQRRPQAQRNDRDKNRDRDQDRDRDYDKRNYREEQNYRGRDQNQRPRIQEIDHNEIQFKDYLRTRLYKSQQELINLIQEKLKTSPPETAQYLAQKLAELSNQESELLDGISKQKILNILNGKSVNEEQLYRQTNDVGDYIGQKVGTSYADVAQSQFNAIRDNDQNKKPEPMTKEEYEEFVEDKLEELAQQLDNQRRDESEFEDQRDYSIFYNKLKDINNEAQNQIISSQRGPRGLQKSIEDQYFQQYFQIEDLEKQKVQGQFFDEDEFDNNETTARYAQQTGVVEELKIIKQETLEDIEDVSNDIFNEIKGDIKSQYSQINNFQQKNKETKKHLAVKINNLRRQLDIVQRESGKIKQNLQTTYSSHFQDALPTKNFDFVGQQSQLQREKENLTYLLRLSTKKYKQGAQTFETFVRDLKVLNRLALYQKIPAQRYQTLAMSEKVQQQMHQAGFHLDINQLSQNQKTLLSALFEYSALKKNEYQATLYLKNLVLGKDQQDQANYINTDILKQFYQDCLQKDKFNSLGYLIAYLEKNDIDISSWNISNFNSAVDFYLNTSFSSENLLIFTKFYTYFHVCRLRHHTNQLKSPVEKLDDSEKHKLNNQIFNYQDMPNMGSLFSILVEKLGSNSIIDPITKDDAIWRLINFFTEPTLLNIRSFSTNQNNQINDEDVALYFKNHFEDQKTFERVTTVILRLQNKPTQFHNYILQYLREYQSKNGSLPFSFDQAKIRNTYIRLKAAQKAKSITISDKTAEYLLFLLKSSQMWPEIIDFSQNYNVLTGNNSQTSNEIQKYYLSDALLKMPIGQQQRHYYQIIDEAVYPKDQQNEASQGYVTAMTKAYFKDGNSERAVQFFKNCIDELREKLKEREDYLISIFDATNGTSQMDSFESFKQKYYKMIELGNKSVRENYAVQQIQKVIQNKDYNEIDQLFSLYIVQKEEALLQKQYGIQGLTLSDYDQIQDIPEEQKNRLQAVKLRREYLQKSLNNEDVQILNDVNQVVNDSTINIFKGTDYWHLRGLQKIFPSQSKEEIQQTLERTSRINKIISTQQTEQEYQQQNVLQTFYNKRKNDLEHHLSKTDDFYYEREIDDEQEHIIENTVSGEIRAQKLSTSVPTYNKDEEENEQVLSKLSRNRVEILQGKVVNHGFGNQYIQPRIEQGVNEQEEDDENDDYEEDLQHINRYNFYEDLEEDDPEMEVAYSHDKTLVDMKEQLLDALNQRKGSALKIAIDMFNKIQEQTLKVVSLNDINKSQINGINDQSSNKIEQVDEILSKINLLVNNQRSPVYQVLQDNQINHRPLESMNQEYKEITDIVTKAQQLRDLEIEDYQLNTLMKELNESHQLLQSIQTQLLKEQQQKQSNQLNQKRYETWDQKKDEMLTQQLEQRAAQLYTEYKKSWNDSQDKQGKAKLSRDQKLSLMKDVLSLELGADFASPKAVFSPFYAQDLIIFGLENNIPEAIRLGENIMSEIGQTLSRDLQIAVKNYLLEYSEKYREASKITGLVDNSTLYKSVQQKRNSQEETPVFFNIDDPYWQHLISKNADRQNQWRTPSYLAWDHKPRGIIDEIFDMKRLEKQSIQLNKII